MSESSRQISAYNELLSYRISLQKSLDLANTLPSSKKHKKFKEAAKKLSKKDEYKKLNRQARKSTRECLTDLLDLHKITVLENENSTTTNKDSITNYTRDELQELDDELLEKHILSIYENQKNDYLNIMNEWSSTINTHNDESIFRQSLKQQIEKQLDSKEKQKLMEKSQVNRSNFHIFGESDYLNNTQEQKEKVNTNIYDDSETFQFLLRQYVKATKSKDGFLQIREARDKYRTKKRHDTGRKDKKVTYEIHEPLVNFMTPVFNELPVYTNSLFASLFKSN
eukprot:TRINITY_DN2128_c0_g2_i1.p1 TRINITY_DN2128_c0_g2~~TRINITY_DN2128_c0_g2_i1.p1  ORF type:complete len:294 (+),score=76.17 TRINITY_DN2128_c0_g2_i1:38-883(+)